MPSVMSCAAYIAHAFIHVAAKYKYMLHIHIIVLLVYPRNTRTIIGPGILELISKGISLGIS